MQTNLKISDLKVSDLRRFKQSLLHDSKLNLIRSLTVAELSLVSKKEILAVKWSRILNDPSLTAVKVKKLKPLWRQKFRNVSVAIGYGGCLNLSHTLSNLTALSVLYHYAPKLALCHVGKGSGLLDIMDDMNCCINLIFILIRIILQDECKMQPEKVEIVINELRKEISQKDLRTLVTDSNKLREAN